MPNPPPTRDIPPKVGRCFHVRATPETVYIKVARDMGFILYYLLVVSLREAVVEQPSLNDLLRLSLANQIENNLDIPRDARVGLLTLPNTCDLEFFKDELLIYAESSMWDGWRPAQNFSDDFVELSVALEPIVARAKCICPPPQVTS